MKVAKVRSNGQLTIPRQARDALGIKAGSHLEVRISGEELRLRKVAAVRPLSDDDPIWELIGAGQSKNGDVSEHHDRYLAEASIPTRSASRS